MARRFLGMSAGEWGTQPWWLRKVYLEGLESEGLVAYSEGSGDPTVVSEEVHRAGSTTIVDRKHQAVFSGDAGEMAAFGIPERTL